MKKQVALLEKTSSKVSGEILPEGVESVLFSKAQIKARVKSLARAINRDYKGKDLVIVGILKGSFMFLADLMRELNIATELDFLSVSSYEGDKSSGMVKLHFDIRRDIKGRNVLLADDIVDTGFSLVWARNHLLAKEPKSLSVCVLLDKAEKRKVLVPLRYVGFTVSDYFVIGYGLDYNEKFRDLPYIGILKSDALKP